MVGESLNLFGTPVKIAGDWLQNEKGMINIKLYDSNFILVTWFYSPIGKESNPWNFLMQPRQLQIMDFAV